MTEEKREKKVKKEKRLRVWSLGFVFSILMIALVTLYTCFRVGLEMSDNLPF